ncbi:MAG: ATP-binding protein [Chloroflexota bacterium]
MDYPHLKRLAANLLSNGMKFSEPDRVITLEFGMDNGRFLLSITDQGIGILPDEQPFIYDLFFRGSNIETRRGLGLGLNIVQTIVAAFGGSITVHSEGLNRGTSFRVALPIDEETAVLPISSAPTRAS